MNTISELQNLKLANDIRVDSLQDDPSPWNFVAPARNVLYYTFDVSPGSVAAQQTTTPFVAFNAAQQNAARAILAYAGPLIGVTFTEVATSAQSDFHFAATDINGNSNVSGLASTFYNYSFSGTQIVSLNAESVIWLDNVEFATANNTPTANTQGYETLLHEIGHALGLGHPFEGTAQSPGILPAAQDNSNNTVMSYTHVGAFKTTFQAYDQLALTWIYGGDGLGGTYGYNSIQGNTLNPTPADATPPLLAWSSPVASATGVPLGRNLVLTFNEAVQRGTGTLVLRTAAGTVVESYDMASNTGNVTLSGKVLTVNPTADLAANTSYVLTVAPTAVKDLAGNAYAGGSLSFTSQSTIGVNTGMTGTDRNDQLQGTAGNDVITPGLGIDVVNGGAGNDTVALKMFPSFHSLVQAPSGTVTDTYAGNSLTMSSVESVRFGTQFQTTLPIANLLSGTVKTQVERLTDLYLAFFGRAPDVGGLEYWQKQLLEGLKTQDQITTDFAFSQEAQALFPTTGTNREFVRTVYVNSFGRQPDAAGWDYWTQQLDKLGSPTDLSQRGSFVASLLLGAYAPTSGAQDRTQLTNKHDVALYYGNQLSLQSQGTFDAGINNLLTQVTLDPATKTKAIAVIDYVVTNPVTLSGVLSDPVLFNSI